MRKTIDMHICIGVGKDFTCHFEGACYGEICIAPDLCQKKVKQLSSKEKAYIKKFKTGGN